jgi:hypothetical protein
VTKKDVEIDKGRTRKFYLVVHLVAVTLLEIEEIVGVVSQKDFQG